MTQPMHITPEVLRWARESAGYSVDDVVETIKQKRVTEKTVLSWESGNERPTYPQLKKMAKKYNRPIAIFFFPQPPQEDSVEQEFRTLPSNYAKQVPPRIRFLVRKAKIKQIELEELHAGVGINVPAIELQRKSGERAVDMAERIRGHIGVSIETQKGWNDTTAALEFWRTAVQQFLGVWIFKDSFSQDDYCGFCLYDEKFPIIYLNNNQAKSRQIFTLFHELGHILSGKAGVDFRTAPVLTGEYQTEEVFCNAFAGALLVPQDEIVNHFRTVNRKEIEKEALRYARVYNVSFEVIIRRLLDRNVIANEQYQTMLDRLEKRYRSASKNGSKEDGGGNYYSNMKSYLGQKFVELAFEQYYNQKIDQRQLAEYLGVKEGKVLNLMDTLV